MDINELVAAIELTRKALPFCYEQGRSVRGVGYVCRFPQRPLSCAQGHLVISLHATITNMNSFHTQASSSMNLPLSRPVPLIIPPVTYTGWVSSERIHCVGQFASLSCPMPFGLAKEPVMLMLAFSCNTGKRTTIHEKQVFAPLPAYNLLAWYRHRTEFNWPAVGILVIFCMKNKAIATWKFPTLTR